MTSQSQERGQSPANLTKSKFSECMQVVAALSRKMVRHVCTQLFCKHAK